MRRASLAASLLALLVLVSTAAAQDMSPVTNEAIPPLDKMQRVDRTVAKSGTPQVEGATISSWQLEGNAAGVNYGWSCTTVGDVNADGYSDVMVTVDGTTSGTGACHLYLGGAGGLATSPVWSRTNFILGPHAAPAGDVNGDGYGDILVGWADFGGVGAGQWNLYYGSSSGVPTGPFTRSQNGGSYGWSFNTAGDVNGDGYDDIVIGSPRWSCNGTENGIFEIWLGGPSGPLQINSVAYCAGLSNFAHFGYSVGTAGDINADGYADVIVGAPDYAITTGPLAPVHGYMAVYLGGPSGLGGTFTLPAIRMSASQPGCRFGAQVATAGDFNGDGYCDVMCSAPNLGASGAAEVGDLLVYSGGPSPSGSLPLLWGGYEIQSYCHFGASLAPAGDVNGDGYSDLVIGAPDADNVNTDVGYAWVLYGRANSAPTAAQTFYGTQTSEHFGTALGTAGDVDGDGFSDIVVAGPYWSNPESLEGRVVLYRGGADRPQLTAMWNVQGGEHFENVGWSLSAAGDVNADGYGDAIVGAWLYDGPSDYNIGRALLYLGGATGLAPAPVPQIVGDEWGAAFGFNVARAGDVNGDGFEDVIIGQPYGSTPKAKIFPGGPSGVTATPIWTGTGAPGSSYGVVTSTAGDVNGDGYSDVLVGAPADDTYGTDTGRVYLYLGGPGGPSPTPARTFHGTQDSEYFGNSLSGAGDLNKDGYSDIVIGAPLYDAPGPVTDAGRIAIYYGNSVNVGAVAQDLKSNNGIQFGARVAGIGDANGDGYADVAVSAPMFSFGYTHSGAVVVYPGGPGGLNTGASIGVVFGTETEGQLGSSLAGAGDVNGDGKADLLVGSYILGGGDNGGVLLYTDLTSNTPFWSKYGDFNGDWFGFSCAGAGDVNGDGFGDILVGAAAMEANAHQDAGQAFCFLGNLPNGDDGLDRIVRIRRADDSAEIPALGKSPTNQVRVGTLARSAAGPTKLTAEFRLEPKNGGATTVTTFGPTFGTAVPLSGLTSPLLAGRQYAFKARVRSRSPFFPGGPWMTRVLDGRETMDFRTPGVTLDAPVTGFEGVLELAAPRPNPSRGETTLEFTIAAAGHAKLVIHDVAGREIARVADGEFAAGPHRVQWSGLDADGHQAPAGIYFVKLTTASGERVQRVVQMR